VAWQGIALKSQHHHRVLAEGLRTDWVELITEHCLGVRGGMRFAVVEKLRQERPIALHGTTLSIGSIDPLDRDYLTSLKELIDRISPVWVSDHLAWASFGGRQLDLLPLPYTEEALAHVVSRVVEVQEILQRQILLENPSSYLDFADSSLSEWEFLAQVSEQADCGILLDVNNVFVSSRNNGWDPCDYLDRLPRSRIREIHVAGHQDAAGLLIDTHEGPVPESVWGVYRAALRRFGSVPTIVEWDKGVPSLETMLAECERAALIARQEAA
jgi:uncharacterized protein (UPF0276 family)